MAGRAYQASHDLSGPIGGSTYQHEYHGFHKHAVNATNPAQPIRSGTASGDRRNNPHPLEVKRNISYLHPHSQEPIPCNSPAVIYVFRKLNYVMGLSLAYIVIQKQLL